MSMVRTGRRSRWFLTVAGAAAFVVGASAQEMARVVSQAVVTPDNPVFGAQDPAPNPENPDAPATPPATPPAQAPAPPGGAGRGGRGAQRTYQQLIAEAKTDEGLFKVHRAGDNVYFEIPKKELG